MSTLDGIAIDCNAEHPKNVSFLIISIFWGRIIDFMALQNWNADSPISFIPSGKIIDFRLM